MEKTPSERQADHKAAILDECNRTLGKLVAEPDLISPAAGATPGCL